MSLGSRMLQKKPIHMDRYIHIRMHICMNVNYIHMKKYSKATYWTPFHDEFTGNPTRADIC